MNTCVWGVLTPLLAVMVKVALVLVLATGVPLRAAVPSPLSMNVSPAGSAPLSLNAAIG